MVTVEEAAALARALPQVEEGTRYGNRSWSVGGKAFAWERPFSKADLRRFGDAPVPQGPILAITVEDLAEKEAVLATRPKAFFTISHFDGFAAVLVQLDLVDAATLHDAIEDGWLACAPVALAETYLAEDG